MRLQDIHHISEAKYVGNIGMVEIFQFQSKATVEEKAEFNSYLRKMREENISPEEYKKYEDKAWALIKKVTNVDLVD